PGAWWTMAAAVRNVGRRGVAAMAISALDNALWDLKARLLDLPLVKLLGSVREAVPVYGSGGFTSYGDAWLREQLGGWAEAGIAMVKMKVGRDPQRDPERVKVARKAIGDEAQLFVDANGAYARKQALRMARVFAEDYDVRWFEEPVSSDDLEGLRLLRDRAPAGMDITAGEYGYDAGYFRRMLGVRAVVLCDAFHVPLSAHCAPALHMHPACATQASRHIEYFHDHVRIEHLLFEGVPEPVDGRLHPDLSRPGAGITFKHADAEQYRIL